MWQKIFPMRSYPGFGGIVYLLITLFAVLAAINTRVNLLYIVFGMMLGGMLVSGVLNTLMMRSVKIKRLPLTPITLGSSAYVTYQVTNTSRWLPIYGLIIREKIPRKLNNTAAPITTSVPHLLPNSKTIVHAKVTPTHRGVLSLKHMVIWTTFPFGIIRQIIDRHQLQHTDVWPKAFPLAGKLLKQLHRRQNASNDHQSRRNGGRMEFYGARPYRPGDPYKLIDWKRTASTQQIVSREMTSPQLQCIQVVLCNLNDQQNISTATLDRIATLAASVITHAMSKGYLVQLIDKHDDDPSSRFTSQPLSEIMHQLTHLTAEDLHTSQNIAATSSKSVTLYIHPDTPPNVNTANAVHMSAANLSQYLNPHAASQTKEHAA